jgi:tetratricopeptide (TPR) repeat protein
MHNEVRWAIEAGDLAQARAICQKILSELPENLQTLLLLAEVNLEERNFRAATAGFERVLNGDPESYLACAGLGIAADNLGTPKRAVSWYTRALDLDPANAEIRNERDRIFEIAYPGRLQPSGLSRYALGRSLFQSGFRDEGVARFKSALARHPERVEIRLTLAEALWAMAKSGAAQDLLVQLVAAHPRVVKANALLACIAAEGGDLVRGRQLLADVHAQDPEGFIAGSIILQSPLMDYARINVEISTELQPREEASRPASGGDTDTHPSTASWVRWMRDAIWSALRLVKPAVGEVAASRTAWARIVSHIGDDLAPGELAPSTAYSAPTPAREIVEQPTPPRRPQQDTDDQTEVIFPGSPRKRRRADDTPYR